MYRELDYRFRFDEMLLPKGEPARTEHIQADHGPKYTVQERQSAAREFEPKLRILLRLNRISSEDRLILGVCHRFRGAAFHRGDLRHDIAEHFSKLLYVTACNLTLKLPAHSLTWPGNPPP